MIQSGTLSSCLSLNRSIFWNHSTDSLHRCFLCLPLEEIQWNPDFLWTGSPWTKIQAPSWCEFGFGVQGFVQWVPQKGWMPSYLHHLKGMKFAENVKQPESRCHGIRNISSSFCLVSDGFRIYTHDISWLMCISSLRYAWQSCSRVTCIRFNKPGSSPASMLCASQKFKPTQNLKKRKPNKKHLMLCNQTWHGFFFSKKFRRHIFKSPFFAILFALFATFCSPKGSNKAKQFTQMAWCDAVRQQLTHGRCETLWVRSTEEPRRNNGGQPEGRWGTFLGFQSFDPLGRWRFSVTWMSSIQRNPYKIPQRCLNKKSGTCVLKVHENLGTCFFFLGGGGRGQQESVFLLCAGNAVYSF